MNAIQKLRGARATDFFTALARKLSRRTWLVVLGLAGVGAALFAGWDWLASVGLTTFLIGVLPCAVMCGLGLCANRLGGKGGGSCHGKDDAADSEAGTQPQRRA